ncbi:group III truncated hemoglobin [Paremcibacter congregatus]|uniref:Preprotein translocase subunit TatC n=1 Tax=Paremcibacter congregatus TaxID=2043170 RepID=A0A2G4YT67_9PROT|nr:group III truncated hemoglobin [Paremcibacter congregatus]PHZ85529.1 preprotein translocase subunit TatC [Paremcibacter congregatus]QDE26487.1 group III truncated hemoglobin [Paremcibacter congregatus]
MAQFDHITEDNIVQLVDRFYEEIRQDSLLGPIFQRVIGDQWDQHMPKMYAFWSSVMLKTGRYKGRPVPTHMKIGPLEPQHFTHWLALFRHVAESLFVKDVAAQFVSKSEMIAESLQLAIFRSKALEGGIDLAGWKKPLS